MKSMGKIPSDLMIYRYLLPSSICLLSFIFQNPQVVAPWILSNISLYSVGRTGQGSLTPSSSVREPQGRLSWLCYVFAAVIKTMTYVSQ